MKSVVVADAGPLHYLILIYVADVLVSLFVSDELLAAALARDRVRKKT